MADSIEITDSLLDEIEVKANAAEKVTPGHWETDTEPQDDAPHRHDEYAIFDGKGRRFIGTENSDASWGLLETDTCDEYGCAVWNEPARVTTDHIARMDPPTALALVTEIRRLRRHLNENCIPQILRQERAASFNDALRAAALAGYVACAETRHVTLGQTVRDAILDIQDKGPHHG